jgi:hypothetical protein
LIPPLRRRWLFDPRPAVLHLPRFGQLVLTAGFALKSLVFVELPLEKQF